MYHVYMVEKLVKGVEEVGISGLPVILVLFGALLWFVLSITGISISGPLSYVVLSAPLWLPTLLLTFFWKKWVEYVRADFIRKQDYVLLEIRLPREILKSPMAMEAALNGLHQGSGETTFVNRYWEGKTRPWFSLELVSIEGQPHFFIWTRRFFKNLVEAQFYAQYPTIEIHEVPDYTRGVQFDPSTMSLFGCDFKLTKPDPYPIRTYVDYGLDKDPKEEFKIDPISSVIEYLGSLGKGEQTWIQILIRVNKTERPKKGTLFGKSGWKDEAEEEIDKIRKKATPERPGSEFPGFPNPTKGQNDTIAALERSISKPGFDCGIRGIYMATPEAFNAVNISGLTGVLKQFSSQTLNGFAPTRWLTEFDYPWQDFRQRRKNKARKGVLEAYKRRSWFHPPFKTPYYVLNTEELATLYHFPGAAAQTPSLSRIPSTRGEAPPNLPTG